MDPITGIASLGGLLGGIFGHGAEQQADEARQAESEAIRYMLSRRKKYEPVDTEAMRQIQARLMNPPAFAGQWLRQAKALSAPSRVGEFRSTPLQGAFQSGVSTTGA